MFFIKTVGSVAGRGELVEVIESQLIVMKRS